MIRYIVLFFAFCLRFFQRCDSKLRNVRWQIILDSPNTVVSEYCRIEGYENITIGESAYIGRFAWIQCVRSFNDSTFNPNLTIGKRVKMSEFVHIGCASNITIGNDCLFASKVLIIDHHHGYSNDLHFPPAQRHLICSDVKIGNNVFLGDGVIVLPGVTIGDNVIVGANTVVTKDIAENSVVVGSPSRVTKINY